MFKWTDDKELIRQIIDLAQGDEHTKDFMVGMPEEEILQFIYDYCWLGFWEDEDGIHGFIVLEWLEEREANLHVCTFTNQYDWVKAWNEVIDDEIKERADILRAILPERKRGVKILAQRIGFNFQKNGLFYNGVKFL